MPPERHARGPRTIRPLGISICLNRSPCIFCGGLLYPLQSTQQQLLHQRPWLNVNPPRACMQNLAGPPSTSGCSYVWTARESIATWECTSHSFAASTSTPGSRLKSRYGYGYGYRPGERAVFFAVLARDSARSSRAEDSIQTKNVCKRLELDSRSV